MMGWDVRERPITFSLQAILTCPWCILPNNKRGSGKPTDGDIPLSWPYQDVPRYIFNTDEGSYKAPRRIVMLMEQYCHEAEQRLGEMHEMRFMYEESPHYEFGYLMHEIVDRYKKVVHHVRRPMEFQSDNVFITLKHTEQIQHLYFDIYHLVQMMHEIERKYAHLPEFSDMTEEIDLQKVFEEQQILKEKERLEKREKKKQQKFYNKLQGLLAVEEIRRNKSGVKRNKLWPIDYGWEVEDWW